MPVANGFINKKNNKKEFFNKLKCAFNKKLSLFQIVDFPSPKRMFNKDYPFYTSSSNFMINHFKNFSNFLKKNYLKKNSIIIEIGSNDGTLLSHFNKKTSIGFEPSRSVHNVAIKKGLRSINKFFNFKNISKLRKYYGKIDLIFGANVFCHIPDQVDLIKSMDKLLSSNGAIIFEEPYLGSMYKKVSYDQIYDEHIYMFSLTSVKKIYEKFGFELIDAYPQITHGGSMRYVIKERKF